MSQLYVSRKGSKTSVIAMEEGNKMRFQFLGKVVRMPKEAFLRQFRPAVCEERPTA